MHFTQNSINRQFTGVFVVQNQEVSMSSRNFIIATRWNADRFGAFHLFYKNPQKGGFKRQQEEEVTFTFYYMYKNFATKQVEGETSLKSLRLEFGDLGFWTAHGVNGCRIQIGAYDNGQRYKKSDIC